MVILKNNEKAWYFILCPEIEIREVDAMQNYQYMSQSIMELKALGFKVALDNFGKSIQSVITEDISHRKNISDSIINNCC